MFNKFFVLYLKLLFICNSFNYGKIYCSGMVKELERNLKLSAENLTNSFANKIFTVVLSSPEVPFINYSIPINNATIYSGIIVEMLKHIEATLKCRFRFVPCVDDYYGVEVNGSWLGLVGMVYRKEVDFTAAALTVTYDRNRVIDFSSSFYFETIGILIRYPAKPLSLYKLCQAFPPIVWATIGAATIGAVFVLFMLGKLVTDKKSVASCLSLQDCFWVIYRLLIMQTGAIGVTNWANRIFQLFTRISIFLLVATYSGSLIAALTTSRIYMPFNDLHGLANAVDNGQYKICILPNNAFYASIFESNVPDYIILRKFLIRHPEYIAEQSVCEQKLFYEDNVAFFQEVTVLQNLQAKFCHIYPTYMLSDRLFPGYFGFGFPKNSSLNRAVSKVITDKVEQGWISFWASNYSEKPKFCQVQSTLVYHVDIKSLDLTDVGIAFISLAIGVPICFLIFLLEKCTLNLKFKRKRKSLIDNSKKYIRSVSNIKQNSVSKMNLSIGRAI